MPEDKSISELRTAVDELKRCVSYVRDHHGVWSMPEKHSLPAAASGWNFETFEKYINQRFSDLSVNLRERYEAQQNGVTAALAAAEKAVGAALIAAEKAVDKAERAQELRNQVANEFRDSLSDLSGLMWTIKEGTSMVDSVRREIGTAVENLDKKVLALSSSRIEATEALRKALETRIGNLEQTSARVEVTETLRKALETRIGALEQGYANIQGRIWAISGFFAIVVFAVNIGIRFIGR